MNGKTKVQVIANLSECAHKKGDIGYIDGYVQAADNRPYAVVVVGKNIDLVMCYNLDVID